MSNLSGKTLGRFRLVERVGLGSAATVYRAANPGPGEPEIALKVLEPAMAARPDFRERFTTQVQQVYTLGHPNILPVFEYGSREGHMYVAMGLAEGGTLADRIRRGPMEPADVWKILGPIADALHATHEAGVVHLDVKPSNVLFDVQGIARICDFGLARTHLNYAVGTPGYMSPEQAMGEEVDRRADVYALAIMIFEMLTGTRFHIDMPTVALLRATVERRPPSILEYRPDLPAAIDNTLTRALAKRPEFRHQTAIELMWDLTQALRPGLSPAAPPHPTPQHSPSDQREIAPDAFKGSFMPSTAPLAPSTHADPEEQFEVAKEQLMKLFDSALSAGVAVDESSFVVGWNAQAEETFGWKQEEMIGRSLTSTIVPAQYREAHERGFRHYLATGEGPVLGKVIEITALDAAGREFPVELTISPAARSPQRALFVAFIRDISEQKRMEQVKKAQQAVDELVKGGQDWRTAGLRVLEAIGVNLGWTVGLLWRIEGKKLHCSSVWKSETANCPDFEQAAKASSLDKGAGLAGRAWDTADTVWIEDILHEPDLPLALPALRGGLHSAIGLPILKAGEVQAVMEFYAATVQKQDDNLLGRMFQIGRKLGSAAASKDA